MPRNTQNTQNTQNRQNRQGSNQQSVNYNYNNNNNNSNNNYNKSGNNFNNRSNARMNNTRGRSSFIYKEPLTPSTEILLDRETHTKTILYQNPMNRNGRGSGRARTGGFAVGNFRLE